jgi:hypothetical protein
MTIDQISLIVFIMMHIVVYYVLECMKARHNCV